MKVGSPTITRIQYLNLRYSSMRLEREQFGEGDCREKKGNGSTLRVSTFHTVRKPVLKRAERRGSLKEEDPWEGEYKPRGRPSELLPRGLNCS